ncbi:serine hydrolase domain-containing protein [Gaetbulibacter aquiaggeris]|uniref:Serine hydrolase domain-containing protein n=1 Tax=Gaetbulibacter aquiaggeris TaxID=1735373 RepID=A0ABW7MTW7_9FLAO
MNYSIKTLIWVFLIISTLNSYSQKANKGFFNKSQIENKIDSLFSKYEKEPGISIGILVGDSLVVQKQYGLANLEYHIPITNKTSFHVASVSKQFTALAVLMLESEGKLSLDDDIKKYISEMKIENTKISIRNLLHHTSGIRDQWNLLRLAGWRLDDVITNEQVLNLIYNQKNLNFLPNEEFMYSNSGYTLLAEIVSRVSNMSFAEFTQKRIFDPLGMNHTFFVDKVGMVIPHKALSYCKLDNEYVEDIFNNVSVGATNLSTTIEDLSKWALNFNQPKVGTQAVFEKMNTSGVLNNGDKTGYGYGQFIDTYKGVPRISHSGLDASYQAYIGRLPENNMSLLIACNNSSINGGRMVKQLTEICLKNILKKIAKVASQKSVERKTSITLSSSILKTFEGHYWNKKDRYSREIILQNDTLYYAREDGSKTALIPVGHSDFEMLGDEYIAVSFQQNKILLIFDDGYTIEFQKYVPEGSNLSTLKDYCGTFYSQELKTYYTFSIDKDILLANHQRLGNINLKAIMKDFFIGKGSFRDVYFKRDAFGKVIGFNVSASRAKNISFKKIMD